MDAGIDDLQQKIDATGESLVDNKETSQQRLANAPRERKPRGLDWTAILKNAGLETPGYEETIETMKREGRIKK
jgi:hypothetical protein